MGIHEKQITHLVSNYYAPRGRMRMFELGMRLGQLYLYPDDRLIGIMGDPGCGKSALVKGMFPGLELTNDDDGVNVRPLPLLDVGQQSTFFSPHTYHVDIRFETGFTQLPVLADAIMEAIGLGKRVVVEHFELIYPLLPVNANVLIGIGEEVMVTRPGIFGPEPQTIYDVVHKSLPYRLMAHSAEDLCEIVLGPEMMASARHGDVRHGFTLIFDDREPRLDPMELEESVNELIRQNLPITYYDEEHVKVGDRKHLCTGPRTHVHSTGAIQNFHLLPKFIYDHYEKSFVLVGSVGENSQENLKKLASLVR